MELYHLHTKNLDGCRDDKWKEKKEIVITDSFTNRLGNKVNNFNDCTNNSGLSNICNQLNSYFNSLGHFSMENMPLYLIMDGISNFNFLDIKTQKIILKELRDLAFQSALFKREMAMENFRCNNNIKAPSRLHCVYATDEAGISHWKNNLRDGDIEIFRIEALDEPFKTSEIFIPDEAGNYEEMYKNSYRYWNPKFKNINEDANEYLIKGKIKILEKVDEIKKKNLI